MPVPDKPISVHVCHASIADCWETAKARADWLSPAEIERSSRFHQPADHHRHVMGRILMRRVCANHLGCAPCDVPLTLGPNDKPCLVSMPRPLEFNVSHSGDCVIIAWSADSDVGIDVEAMERCDPPALMEMAGVFSSVEQQVLSAMPTIRQPELFYQIWVRKEALLKAEGCGLGGDTRSFSVVKLGGSAPDWFKTGCLAGSSREWEITGFSPLPRHVAAVAAAPGSTIIHHSPEEIGLW